MGRYPNTKLGKTRFLSLQNDIIKYLPDTNKFSKDALLTMLEKYRMVYIKPNVGTGGHGIIRAELIEHGSKRYFYYKYNTQAKRLLLFENFYRALTNIMRTRTYLIQKGIRMLQYQHRPFDIRIMIQKNELGAWEHTGTIGRLAHPKRVVTNYHSGGTPMPLDILLAPHLNSTQIYDMKRTLSLLGLQVAESMNIGYPKIKEYGIDVGLDQNHRPWIFEVNTSPDPFIFLKLNKPRIFRRILYLTRMHGRFLKRRLVLSRTHRNAKAKVAPPRARARR